MVASKNITLDKELSFSNTEQAFASKNDRQLALSNMLFRLMNSKLLVKLFSKLTLFAIKLKIPVSPVIRATVFPQFCGGENIRECNDVLDKLQKYHVGSILDYSVEGKESEEDFDKTKFEVLHIIEKAKNNPAIPYTSLKITGIARFDLLAKLDAKKELSEKEKFEWNKAKTRLNDICFNAFINGVPIYFDAEESWIQQAIDDLAEEMMLNYNKEKAIVLTTLQMYRHDRLEYLHQLIKKAKRDKFFIGIKLVRGAYWEKENERAANMGYPSPVHQSKMDTDADFDEAVSVCLQNVDIITLCAGTHNEKSTMYLVNKMKELGIPNDHPHVYFSQLYGMSDHITYNLAEAGYNVTKYLPYGPIKSVIPYLIRRAEENTAIGGQMGRELKLIVQEKQRRKEVKLIK